MAGNEEALSKGSLWRVVSIDICTFSGTSELPFDRLLKEMDKQILAGNIKEKVLVQAGHTKYRSENMDFLDFTTYEHMATLYREASLIITHGGNRLDYNGDEDG